MKQIKLILAALTAIIFSQMFLPSNAEAQSSIRKRLPHSILFNGSTRGFGIGYHFLFGDFMSVGFDEMSLNSNEGNIVKQELTALLQFRVYPFDSLNVYFMLGFGNNESAWEFDTCEVGTTNCQKVTASFPKRSTTVGFGNIIISKKNNITGGIGIHYVNYGTPELKAEDDNFVTLAGDQFSDQINAGKTSVLITGYYGFVF